MCSFIEAWLGPLEHGTVALHNPVPDELNGMTDAVLEVLRIM